MDASNSLKSFENRRLFQVLAFTKFMTQRFSLYLEILVPKSSLLALVDESYRELSAFGAATLSLASQSSKPGHTLYNYFKNPTTMRRLKSRKPFVIKSQGLLAQNTNAPTWIHNTWKENWTKDTKRLHSFVTNVGPLPSGHELSRLACVRLNRLRTGIGRFGSLMHRWGLTPTAVRDCGAERQTPEHLLYQCPIYSLARNDELLVLDDNTIDWLLNVCPDI